MSEYLAVCALRHRSYLRLQSVSADAQGRCTTCGGPAELFLLPPPQQPGLGQWAERMVTVTNIDELQATAREAEALEEDLPDEDGG